MIASVTASRPERIGAASIVGPRMAPASRIATFSGWASAMRFGTSSPKSSRNMARPRVTRTADSAQASGASQEMRARRAATCPASPRPPIAPAISVARVSQNCTSAKNRAGCAASAAARIAPAWPLAASCRSLVFRAETTAVSAMLKKPLASTSRTKISSSVGKLSMAATATYPGRPATQSLSKRWSALTQCAERRREPDQRVESMRSTRVRLL